MKVSACALHSVSLLLVASTQGFAANHQEAPSPLTTREFISMTPKLEHQHASSSTSELRHSSTSKPSRLSEWTVRPATVQDRSACQDLLDQSFGILLKADYEDALVTEFLPTVAQPLEELLQCGTWYVAVKDSNDDQQQEQPTIVGCGGWTRQTPKPELAIETKDNNISSSTSKEMMWTPHLRLFAVHPDYARQGIATAIWDRTLADLDHAYRELKRPFPVLEVFSTRTAQSFYASLGFQTTESLDLPLPTSAATLFPCVRMRRKPRVEWLVRPATPDDRDMCRAILSQSYQSMLASDYEADLLRALLPGISEPREQLLRCGTWYVVQDPYSQQVVGCGGWSVRRPESSSENTTVADGSSSSSSTTTPLPNRDDPSHHCQEPLVPHLRHFAVLPEYARKGIGKAIWKRTQKDIAEQFHADGLPFPVMEVFSSRTAESFYASLGFQLVEKVDLEMMPGTFLPVLLMRRQPEDKIGTEN